MFLREFLNLDEAPGCNMTESGRACPEHGLNECPGYKMIETSSGVAETSARDKLHQRHQELRKKSGLPNPDYYKELRATYDLPDEERYAKAAELKKKYQVKEARKPDVNFDVEDLKKLEKIRDLPTLKTLAFELISKPSAKPMKPEKVEWFRSALERMDSPLKVIKLMYDLMLSGEGHAVIGSKNSMKANNYRDRFGEGFDDTVSNIATKIGDTLSNALPKEMQPFNNDTAAKTHASLRPVKNPVKKQDVAKAMNEDIERYVEALSRAGYDVVTESATACPECGGPAYSNQMLAEKQDACYHKVKSRYKVWPSAYASGALVRCRKVGAKNWGNKSKK
jgi:hypothetical protein